MNASRDQALLGLALQQGLINSQQAALVRDRHRQFSEANRPVTVSALLRALKYLTDQQIESLEQAAEQARTTPAPQASTAPPIAANGAAPPARPATSNPPGDRRRTTGAQRPRASPPTGVPVAVAAPLPTGQLGKYRLLKTLGQGGMGTVYLAEDSHLGRKVALKVLPKELAANRDFIKRFLAEARVTGKLSHPNIVVAYDIDSSQNTWFMAMEYLDGESLGRRVLTAGAIPWREALGMLKQVLKGLAYAHKNGIIHRDIKPDNLFLDKASGETKILDLGLSKNLHANENAALTQAGMILGTPNYLAPEQAENGVNVDNRADIYSLGATLYHLVVGAPPFDGSTPLAIIQKHLFEPFPDLRKSKPDIPVDVANLIWKMTAKKPSDRFEDCTAAIQAVDDILEGRGYQLSDPLVASGRRPGSSPRNRAGGSGQTAAVRGGTRHTRGHTAIERRSRTGPRPAVPPVALFSLLGIAAVVGVGVIAWLLHTPPEATATGAQPPTGTHSAGNYPPSNTPTPPSTAPTPPPPAGTTSAAPLTTPLQHDPAAVDTDAIFAVTGVAARGLTLSDTLDREMENEEKNAAMRRLMDSNHGGAPSTRPVAAGSEGTPPATPPKPPVLHPLTAAERKTAAQLLNDFTGQAVFRMPVPTVTAADILKANIQNVSPADLPGMRFIQLAQPPKQLHPKLYQAVSVETDAKTSGTLAGNARLRMIIRVEASDRELVDLRLMYSSLPLADGIQAGGAYAAINPCDFTLVDVPLQFFDGIEPAERPWFGYACGTGSDYLAKRRLIFTISDVIIYNPAK